MDRRLPPDLARLGDELTAAAERQVAARSRAARRRRFAVAGVVGALAFAALTPSGLSPADRVAGTLTAEVGAADCEQPRSEKFMSPCERVMVLHRPYAIR
jgi:hypothetical protein